MIERRLLALAMLLGTSVMACTAIIMGSIGDKSDYADGDPTASGSSSSSGASSGSTSGSTSSSSGTQPDKCSLLASQNSYGTEFPDNVCAQCIQDSCSGQVAIACNGGKDKKPWFSHLAACAQNPWVEYRKPGSGASFWECGQYDDPSLKPIQGDSDGAEERDSEICVRDHCLRDPGAPCRLCEVNKKGTGSDAKEYLLREDPCGRLFTTKCEQDVIDCCKSTVIDEYLAYCAYTPDPDNLSKCRELLEAKTDATAFKEAHSTGGATRYSEDDFACATKLAECFDANKSKYECQ